MRPSRSPLSVITLYATVENTRSPAPGGQSTIGGHPRWWRPGRSATSALQPMRAHRDYSPDRDKYVRMGRERPHLRRRASYPNVRPRAPAPAFCPLQRGARPCRRKPSCSRFKLSISKLPARSHARSDPPALAAKIFAAPAPAFAKQGHATKFRLIGVALFLFLDAARGDPHDLLDERTCARGRGQTCARSSSRPMRPRSVRAALNTDSKKQRRGLSGRAWCS